MARKKRQRGANGLPWYRSDRDCWCVPGDSKKSPLRNRHGEIIRGKDSRDDAVAAWHEAMSLTNVGRAGADNEVKVVLELFLQDAKARVSAKTCKSYVGWFQSFIDHWPGLLVRDLKPFHVQQWWDKAHPGWNATTRNLSGSSLKAALNWAAKPGGGGAFIPNNPLLGMTLPTRRKRASEVVVTQEEFDSLLGTIRSKSLRDMLTVAWVTGTRPVNLSRATARNVTDDGKALLFADWNTDPDTAVHKTFKRTGRPLVVPLPAAAREVVNELKAKHPEGLLFRTPRGKPWTDARLGMSVNYYAKKAGLGGRFTAYSCRHSRATALLEQGVSDVDVAAVLGNTPSIIHRNYSHVSANVERLLGLMERGREAASVISETRTSMPAEDGRSSGSGT
jgi:integrase